MKLSYAQKREIVEKGFVHISGVVPKVLVDAALRAINHSVGEGMNVEDMTKYRAQSYCPDVKNTPVITDLFTKTPAWDLCESALGEGSFRAPSGGQIALRFPTMQDPPKLGGPHLDGMYSPTNGVPQGTIGNFTMLFAVFLSDVTTEFAGNFTAWPGTHHLYEQYFREHGPDALLDGMPKIQLPEPQQIKAKAGDVVLCHYQIAHTVAMNVSPHPRYAIFFRLTHVDHHLDWRAPMKDIWLHWPGIREVL